MEEFEINSGIKKEIGNAEGDKTTDSIGGL